MKVDKIHLLILAILEEQGATMPGSGLTMREIATELNQGAVRQYSQMTVNRKVWFLRDHGYIAAKVKSNNADMYYILTKGREMKEVLLSEE